MFPLTLLKSHPGPLVIQRTFTQWIIMWILRLVPSRFKLQLYNRAVEWCERNGREIRRSIYRLPFDLVLKITSWGGSNEAAALRFIESIGINSARFIDHVSNSRDEDYILMTYIPGDCCCDVWDDLTASDKDMFVAQLHKTVNQLRDRTISHDHPICNVEGKFIHDPRIPWVARNTPKVFTTSAEFFSHVWPQLTYRTPPLGGGEPLGPLLRPIIDRTDRPIVFCHGDIIPRNIMLPGGLDAWRKGLSHLCLIDWQNAGWMPLPWEALKTVWLYSRNEEWCQMMRNVFPESCTEMEADWDWRRRTHVCIV